MSNLAFVLHTLNQRAQDTTAPESTRYECAKAQHDIAAALNQPDYQSAAEEHLKQLLVEAASTEIILNAADTLLIGTFQEQHKAPYPERPF